jgi:protein-disulfide isomerase
MSSQSVPSLRRERRAAALARRRGEARRATGHPRRVGIGLVSLAALAAGVVLVAVILVLGGSGKPAAAGSVVRALAPAGIPAAGHVLGSATAPVTIDLYEDFQCPACEQWGRNVVPSLVRNELAAGTVRIVYHGFAFIGPESIAAGRAAWAAEQQGRFWDMWATLYANQGLHENGGAFDRIRLIAMADTLGLDAARFATDLDAPAAAAFVADGVADAARAGVTSTPTLIIEGRNLANAGYTEVAAAIAASVAP